MEAWGSFNRHTYNCFLQYNRSYGADANEWLRIHKPEIILARIEKAKEAKEKAAKEKAARAKAAEAAKKEQMAKEAAKAKVKGKNAKNAKNVKGNAAVAKPRKEPIRIESKQ